MDEDTLSKAQALQDAVDQANIQISRRADDVLTKKQELEGSDLQDTDLRDPSIIAADVATQIAYFRKLKFQYLEQNAKDKYVKSIVSDIDDAPIVSADDNKNLIALNEERKRKLKDAKTRLAEVQSKTRAVAPQVENEYTSVKQSVAQASALSQKIIDARLALSRLRRAHPAPRLTEQSATEKLAEQEAQMVDLTDQVETLQGKVREAKDHVKKGVIEVDGLRTERVEVEKNLNVEVDDDRWLPIYDWLTQALSAHRAFLNLELIESSADNEVRLSYRVDAPGRRPRIIAITLIFHPGTRQLASVDVSGIEDTDIDLTELIDAHVPSTNAPGVIAAIALRVRDSA